MIQIGLWREMPSRVNSQVNTCSSMPSAKFHSGRIKLAPSPPSLTGSSGKKKEPKPKLFGKDIFGWGGGLPREGVGGQKVRYVPRKPGKPNFLAGYPGIFGGISWGCLKSLRKKFVFNFRPLDLLHESTAFPPPEESRQMVT